MVLCLKNKNFNCFHLQLFQNKLYLKPKRLDINNLFGAVLKINYFFILFLFLYFMKKKNILMLKCTRKEIFISCFLFKNSINSFVKESVLAEYCQFIFLPTIFLFFFFCGSFFKVRGKI